MRRRRLHPVAEDIVYSGDSQIASTLERAMDGFIVVDTNPNKTQQVTKIFYHGLSTRKTAVKLATRVQVAKRAKRVDILHKHAIHETPIGWIRWRT